MLAFLRQGQGPFADFQDFLLQLDLTGKDRLGIGSRLFHFGPDALEDLETMFDQGIVNQTAIHVLAEGIQQQAQQGQSFVKWCRLRFQ
jgi:hypothetical protein